MPGPFDDLVGELEPGDTGWLPLDADGNPTGPATLLPPPPPALACSVMANPEVPLPEGHHLLTTSTGAPLVPPLQSNVDPRDDDWVAPTPIPPPVIISLAPSTAVSGSTDFELTVVGTGFTPESVIVFAHQDEPTDYFGPDTLRTGVKPSLFVPATVGVHVRNADGQTSFSQDFTFTEPVERDIDRMKEEHRRREKGDDPISTSPKRK